MDQTIIIVAAIVVVGVVVAVFLARQLKTTVATSKNETDTLLSEEIINLQQENARLQQHSNTLANSHAEVKANAEYLADEVRELSVQNAALLAEKKQVLSQSSELRQKNDEVLSELNSIRERLHETQAEVREKRVKLEAEAERFEAQQIDFEKQKTALTNEFKTLSETILKARQEDLKKQNDEGVKALLSPLEEQLKSFKDQVTSVHNHSVKQHSGLEVQIENVMKMGIKMSDEANSLSSALKGKSQARGAWGEAMLEQTLEMSGLVKDTHYTAQNSQRDEENKHKRPDILIKVPGGKNLIIDSKVTLNAYDRLVSANSEEEASLAMADHISAVKKHMDDLSKKNYDQIAEFRSPDFVLMFMPLEAAYIEALRHDRELYSYGFSKRVVLVSHTTLIPILRTVANLWTIDQGNKAAKGIADKAGDIYNSVTALAENVLKMGNQLKTVSGTYNKVVGNLSGQRGLYGKVERFSLTSEKVKKQLPDIQAQYVDIETEKLEAFELQDSLPAPSVEEN